MTDIDNELDNILTVQYNLVTTSDLKATLKRYIQDREAALLSRIKEEAPKDKKLKDGEGSMTSNTILVIQNEQNAKWRTTIDNIAKEIRGEG